MGTKACPFCAELIHPEARKCKYCGEILDPSLQQTQLRSEDHGSQKEIELLQAASKAQTAMWCGIFALCCWIVLGPIAIAYGTQANKLYQKHGYPSNGQATAGVVLGIIMCVLGCLGTILNFLISGLTAFQRV